MQDWNVQSHHSLGLAYFLIQINYLNTAPKYCNLAMYQRPWKALLFPLKIRPDNFNIEAKV